MENIIDPKLPFIDLHRHIDGNVRLETIIDLGKTYSVPLPAWEEESLASYVQVQEKQPGVMAFIEKFKWMMAVLVDYQACQRVAYENVEDAWKEGLDYIELRFSPLFMAETHNLEPSSVVASVCEGIEQGRETFGMNTNIIGIISRTYGVEFAKCELDALLTKREYLVGIDLAGDEVNYPADLFIEHFGRVRDAGLAVIAHAGESAGPTSIWAAIDDLQAIRIGHGIAAIQDPYLREELAKRKIGIEVSLTSNIQTSIVANYESHPVRKFLEANILVNINTDDPGISGIDLAYEYNVAAPAAGLCRTQIHQAQMNALTMALLSDQEKLTLIEKKRN